MRELEIVLTRQDLQITNNHCSEIVWMLSLKPCLKPFEFYLNKNAVGVGIQKQNLNANKT